MRYVLIIALFAMPACTDVSGLEDPWGSAAAQGKAYPGFMNSADLYDQTHPGAAHDVADLQARAAQRPALADLGARDQAAYLRDLRARAADVRGPVLTKAERTRLLARISG